MRIPFYLTQHKNRIPLQVKLKLHGGSGSILPDGYTRLEYIESTGTQSIDTGVSAECTLDIDIQFTRRGYRELLGKDGSAGNYFGKTATNQYEIGQGDGMVMTGVNALERHVISVYMGRNLLSLTTENKTISRTDVGFKNITIKLFNRLTGTLATYSRVYSCKIKNDNGELIRDFIPCLDTNGEPCMYDVVGQQTYYNAGTGRFRTPFDAPLMMMSAPMQMMSLDRFEPLELNELGDEVIDDCSATKEVMDDGEEI